MTIGEEHEEVVAQAWLIAVLARGFVHDPSQQSQTVSFFFYLALIQR